MRRVQGIGNGDRDDERHLEHAQVPTTHALFHQHCRCRRLQSGIHDRSTDAR